MVSSIAPSPLAAPDRRTRTSLSPVRWREARGAGAVALPRDFRADDLEEFRIVGERAHPRAARPGTSEERDVLVLESTEVRHLGRYGSPVDAKPKLTAEAATPLEVDGPAPTVGLTVYTFR